MADKKISKRTVNKAKSTVKKTAKKHPKIVIAIAIILIIVIVGLVVGAYFYTGGDFSRLPYLLGLQEEPPAETPSAGEQEEQPIVVPPSVLGAEGQLAIYCINVGQGNSALIAFPDGKFMLIDAGNTTVKESTVKTADAKKNLFDTIDAVTGDGEIDYLIATHPDSDHTNLLDDVLISYQVNMVMYNDIEPETQTYQNFIDLAAAEPNCQIVKIGEYGFEAGGNEYEIKGSYGENEYKITIYASGYKIKNEANAMSPIIVFEYGEFEGIIYGDGTTVTEAWWINYMKSTDNISEFDIDFLYVAHHGSDTSSSEEFLRFVKAEYAVISCGEGNKYDHPKDIIMTRLDSIGVATYRTDKHGTTIVAVSPDGNFGFLPQNKVPLENNSVGRNDLIISATDSEE